MAQLQMSGNISDAVGGVLALADIRITQGRLHDAMRTYERALQLARENGTPTLRGTADMYVGMSELEREHNDLQAATQLLLRSQEQGEHTGFPQHPYRWCVAMARLREAQGDLDGAVNLLDEAEPLYVSDFFPNARPIAALKARVWVAQDRLSEALGWGREHGLSAEDSLSYLREFEHITLARLLLAQYKSDHSESALREAIGLLERLLRAAEESERKGSAIEILALQALAYQLQGEIPVALTSLERALTLAKPEGYVRMFLDEGASMEQLLREAAGRGILPGYTGRLLSAFDAEGQTSADQSTLLKIPVSQPLIEPLTERELELLRLFKTELSGPEIARELVIGLSTVRTHTKSIYSKLNVNSRRAAVRRAEELGLI
jgi:LuxR family maltose regulon positive regulatory protein